MLFLLVSIIMINLVALFMPKRISYIEMYATSLFALALQLNVDIFLEFKYKYYWYFDEGVDPETLLIVLGLYPQTNMIFLNFFPVKRRFLFKAFYIIGWSLFAIGFEWCTVQANIFHYNGWKLWYSATIYPALYTLLLLNLLFTKYLLEARGRF